MTSSSRADILLRRLELELGFVPARMKAGDAGRFFEDQPARLRLGIDDLADLALPHEGGRARAGRGIGEQQLHVARAHVAAIDAIGRARLALDAARDLERLIVVELGRRSALVVVERHHHFRHVAGGPLRGAGEDDIVHAGGAHVLVGAFAHHPAQRFEQIGLAAAIGADDAGQALLDDQVPSVRRTT